MTMLADKSARIDELLKILKEANLVYRSGGEPIMTDKEFDSLEDELEEIDPFNSYFDRVGEEVIDEERKQLLPVPMASMVKIKTIDAYNKWRKTQHINDDEWMICTPKLDSVSFCVDERNMDGWSRGDGEYGQYSNEHYKLMQNRNPNNRKPYDFYSIGEVIMPRNVFEKNKFVKDDGTLFKNPRNLVAGKINDKKADSILSHCLFMRYGMFSDNLKLNKDEQLILLNELNAYELPFIKIKAGDITEDFFNDLFKKWNTHFELDGIIVEVNDYSLREKIGRERKNNPSFARAFKGKFEDVADTLVEKVNIAVSKQGFLKPVVEIVPVLLNGATVTNPTGYNFKFIKANGIGAGATVRVIRSGMVIPKIIETIKKVPFQMPTECPECKGEVAWNESNVEIMCINIDCPSQRLGRIIAFFAILKVPDMGEGVCEQLYNAGYDTVSKILNMSKEEMMAIDRFGERKSEKLYTNIKKTITDVPLPLIQHASGCFVNLGSTKLEMLINLPENPKVSDIIKIPGFKEISAKSYLMGLPKFNEFIKDLPVTIKTTVDKIKIVSDKCKGWSVVFTGYTDKLLEDVIKENGGEISSGVSKKTTHLVMKNKGSGSSKEQKAEHLGIPIYDKYEFTDLVSELFPLE